MNRRSVGWRGTVVFGLLFVVAGLYAFLVAAATIPPEAVGLQAPSWMAALAGGVFGLSGAVLVLIGMAQREGGSGPWAEMLALVRGWAGAAIISLMAIAGGWIAFGPGERKFSGGISLPFLSLEGPSPEFQGRCAFGVGAILAGLIAAYAWVDAARGWFRGRTEQEEEVAD